MYPNLIGYEFAGGLLTRIREELAATIRTVIRRFLSIFIILK
jgi:hypothetical protein